MCVCVCACVRACVHACTRARVRVCVCDKMAAALCDIPVVCDRLNAAVTWTLLARCLLLASHVAGI